MSRIASLVVPLLLLSPVHADGDNEVKFYYERGIDRLEKMQYDKAIEDFTQAIQLDPKNGNAHHLRGFAFYKKMEYDKAIENYSQAIRIDSKDANSYNFRGIAYYHKNEYDKAIEDYGQAIRLKYVRAYYNRGIAFTKTKQYDRAIEDYGQAIKIDPKNANAFINRGFAHLNKKRYDNAIEDYVQAISINPTDTDAHGGLAWILATCPKDGIRDGKKAIEQATKACELSNWKDAKCLESLAAAHAEAGEFKNAIKWQEKAIGLGYEDREESNAARKRLRFYEEGKPFRD